jgi:uncharacterized protein (DUF302 family)
MFADADPAAVLSLQTQLQVDAAYDRIYKGLEVERFWVLLEANVGEQMARNADQWGIDYNRNKLGAARTMVFGNIGWTNRIANADPALLALYPLHLSIYERGGTSYVVLPRLAAIAKGSPGEARAMELDAEIRRILEKALGG